MLTKWTRCAVLSSLAAMALPPLSASAQNNNMHNNNMTFLAIQTKVQNVSQTSQLMTNIYKSDSDAKLNAIRNFRASKPPRAQNTERELVDALQTMHRSKRRGSVGGGAGLTIGVGSPDFQAKSTVIRNFSRTKPPRSRGHFMGLDHTLVNK
jgi:hypothetical protein